MRFIYGTNGHFSPMHFALRQQLTGCSQMDTAGQTTSDTPDGATKRSEWNWTWQIRRCRGDNWFCNAEIL